MAITGATIINPFVHTKNTYVTLRDFTPIARTAQPPLALVMNNDVPVKTFAEFIGYARENFGEVNYGSAGSGSISQAAGVDMLHLP